MILITVIIFFFKKRNTFIRKRVRKWKENEEK